MSLMLLVVKATALIVLSVFIMLLLIYIIVAVGSLFYKEKHDDK